MHLYEVHAFEEASPKWRRTLAEAHAVAKSFGHDDVSIMLRDYPSDQQAFCDAYNGVRAEGKPLRRWKLTARGGLREVPVDGSEPKPEVKPTRKRERSEPQADAGPVEPPDAFWERLNASRSARKLSLAPAAAD